MSSVDINVPFVGQQASELTLLRAFEALNVNAYMRVEENVGYQRQFARLGSSYRSLRKDTTCAKTTTYTNEATEKILEVTRIFSQADICVNDYFEKFVADQLRTGADSGDLTDTQIASAILERFMQDTAVDVSSLIWFGDTDLSDPFYNILNGLFKQIKLAVAAGDIVRTQTLGNGDLADCAARDILRGLHTGANVRLKQVPNNQKVMLVSGEIWENWLACKELGDSCCTELGWTLEVEGTQALAYRGIPVLPMWNWDRVVDEQVVAVYDNRYHAVYTTIDNLMLGTDRFASTNEARVWYSVDDDQNYMRMKFPLGVTVFDEGLIAVAY